MMTSTEFVNKAIDIAKNYKTLYVMGCFGAPLTKANKSRYTSNYYYNSKADRKAMIESASDDTFGFDCVCLIKAILWGWNGNKSANYGGADYASNGVPDINEDAMINKCSDVSTTFNNIVEGEVVWMSGHIGIYIGDGLAVECTPAWDNKVQITACNCTKSGYHTRNWMKHGKLPYITYESKKEEVKEKSSLDDYTDEELAVKVWAGEFGNGDARKKALGSRYEAVQAIVDKGSSSSAKIEVKEQSAPSSFFPSCQYFKYGDTHENIGKIASFMYRVFPAYTKKAALGNYYGENINASITEFQKRVGITTENKKIGSLTLAKLKEYGFTE